ncbi:MAG: MFS transporter [Candidatus Eremiobacteraeota bacterium]|nr:MFS transporter [Candidatus Eremiobacteraeota bacterium]
MVTAGESIFASRSFRQYYIGQAFSYFGDGLRLLTIPLLVFYLTHRALGIGIAFILEVAPFAFFGPFAGAIADRMDRRKLMILCDFVRLCVLVCFAVLFFTHRLTVPMIYGGLVVLSIAAAFFMSGQAPSIPYLLGKDRTTEAVSVLVSAESGSNLIGPMIGTTIMQIVGPLPALVINAFTYGVSQLSLFLVPTLGPDVIEGMPTIRELLSDVRDGFRFALSDPAMRAMMVLSFFLNMAGFGGYSILIPFLKHSFAASDQQIGIFFAFSACGNIIGAVAAGKFATKWPFGRTVLWTLLIDGIIFIPFIYATNFYIAAIFWSMASACAGFEVTLIIGWRLRITPDQLVGRVTGVVRLVVLAGLVPGVLTLTLIADHISAHVAMTISAYSYLVMAIVGCAVPSIRRERR